MRLLVISRPQSSSYLTDGVNAPFLLACPFRVVRVECSCITGLGATAGWLAKRVRVAQPAAGWLPKRAAYSQAMNAVAPCCDAGATLR